MRKHVVALCNVTLLSLWSPHLWSAEFTVNHLPDDVDARPGDGQCATAEQRCTLRAAIQEANALAGADVIVLPSGTYPLSLGSPGENKAKEGDLDITEDLTLTGAGATSTIIDGGGRDRHFEIFPGIDRDTRVAISGVTLSRGRVLADGAHGGAINNFGSLHLSDAILTDNAITGLAGQGGALCNRGGTVTLERVELTNNKARLNGGALCNLDAGTLSMSAVQVKSNSTDTGDGSSHHHGGALVSDGKLIVRDSAFSQNTSYFGGGAFLTAGSASFVNVEFDSNRSVLHGAGLHVGSHGEGGVPMPVDLKITGSRITNNEITEGGSGGHGGGLFITGESFAYLEQTEVSRNSARGPCGSCPVDGGGLYNDKGTVTINRVSVVDNTASRYGGGIYNNTGATLRVVASTVQGNRAWRVGGGIAGEYSRAADGAPTATVEHSLIAFNRAALGGGIAGSVTVRNTTLWGNTASIEGGGEGSGGAVYVPLAVTENPSRITYRYRTDLTNVTVAMNGASATGAQLHNTASGVLRLQATVVARAAGTPNCVGSMDTLDYNVESDGSCTLAGLHDLAADPLIEDLAERGGPTLSPGLAPTSPAIDAVPAAVCPALDQRLYTRTEDCDAGAFEVAGAPAASGTVAFAQGTAEAPEGEAPLIIAVERRDGAEGPASIDYVIRSGTALLSEDTDIPATAQRGTLTWASGDMAPKALSVALLMDEEPEAAETFTVELYNPVGADLGETRALTVTIIDSTPAAAPAPTPTPAPAATDTGGGPLAWSLLALLGAALGRRRRTREPA